MNRWQTGDEFRGAAARQDVPALLADRAELLALARELAEALDKVRTTTFSWSLSGHIWNDLYEAIAKARAAGLLEA